MVELHSMDDWATLPVTKWNIKQPAFEDNRANALDTGKAWDMGSHIGLR